MQGYFYIFLFVSITMLIFLIYYINKRMSSRPNTNAINESKAADETNYTFGRYKLAGSKLIISPNYIILLKEGLNIIEGQTETYISKEDILDFNKFNCLYKQWLSDYSFANFYDVDIYYKGNLHSICVFANPSYFVLLTNWLGNVRQDCLVLKDRINEEVKPKEDDETKAFEKHQEFEDLMQLLISSGRIATYPRALKFYNLNSYNSHELIYIIYKNNITKDMKIITRLDNSTYIEDLDFDEFKYFQVEGNIDKELKIEGGEIKGGDYSFGKATLGYALAGTAGAVISGKNSISQTPIKTKYTTKDTRRTVLYCEDKYIGIYTIELPKEIYSDLVALYPEKTYKGYILSTTNKGTSKSGYNKVPLKGCTKNNKQVNEVSGNNLMKQSLNSYLVKYAKEELDVKKVYKAAVSKYLMEYIGRNYYETTSGQRYGYIKDTLIVRMKKCDIQVKLRTLSKGLTHYVPLDEDEDLRISNEFDKNNIIDNTGDYKYEAKHGLRSIIRDAIENECDEVLDGKIFGFTENTFVIRFEQLDISVSLLAPRIGIDRYTLESKEE